MKEKEEQLDRFLESLCKHGGKAVQNEIEGYDFNLESVLSGLGYIKVDGEGIWKEISVTDAGRKLYREGGFKGVRIKEEEKAYDRGLENRSKILNNRVIVATLIVSLLSLAATIYFGLKNG